MLEMDIPVVIFKDKNSVYGVKVPNIKGVHSWGDMREDALKNVREATTNHIETLLELGEPVEMLKARSQPCRSSLNMPAVFGHWPKSTLISSTASPNASTSACRALS